MEKLLEKIAKSSLIKDFLALPKDVVFGTNCSLDMALRLYFLAKTRQKKIVLVCSDLQKAQKIVFDINLIQENFAHYLPDFDLLPYEGRSSSLGVLEQRIVVLQRLHSSDSGVFCMSAAAALRRLPIVKKFPSFTIKTGQILPPEQLSDKLISCGYERHYQAYNSGEFAQRGEIFDICIPGGSCGVRLEYDYDAIGRIRFFDLQTQLTNQQVASVKVLPAREFSLFEATPKNDEIAKKIKEFGYYQGVENDLSAIFSTRSIAESDELLLFLDDLDLSKSAEELADEALQSSLEAEKIWVEPSEIFASVERLKKTEKPAFVFSGVQVADKRFLPSSLQAGVNLQGNLKLLEFELKRATDAGHTLTIQADNKAQIKRLKNILSKRYQISYELGVFSSGFCLEDVRLTVFTDHQIFNRYVGNRSLAKGKKVVEKPQFLEQGEYLVHSDYGVGIYGGLKTTLVDGKTVECLVLYYQGGDAIFLPSYSLDKVSKFVAAEGVEVKQDKIGSKKWRNTKAKVKKKIEVIAKDLVDFYAKRSKVAGISFLADDQMQESMEAEFLYEPTRDQLAAIEQIKKDMQAPSPMERLLCGDVGYGKTEVAIRAAFKAVCSSYQVAVLSPTTLLCEQLFTVFSQRLAMYPVKIKMLSRFVKKSEQAATIKELQEGRVDIVIGTHRLLSKDIAFAKLGLLVIDEEHRFGVRAKEKLRKLKHNIDTLYMSATPIPRTLNMALSGVKDISLILSGPKQRVPINSVVSYYQKSLLRNAIQKEVSRGGQVFFVHNRVESIQKELEKLQKLLPSVSMKVAHGQMKETELEKIILDFYHNKFSVLVCTSIIENGIDIANANTIIVNRADLFGLSSLYQLKGRVGRSSQRGYCYYLLPKGASLEQRNRLQSLSAPGSSGYKVAMLDMQVRGVGSMVGTGQSGNIAQIGFNYYNNLLSDAIASISEGKKYKPQDVDLEVDGEFYIPADYIEDAEIRLEIYSRMLKFTTKNQFDQLVLELENRFGELPSAALSVVTYYTITMFAKTLGIKKIKHRKKRAVFVFDKVPAQKTLEGLMKSSYQVEFDLVQGFELKVVVGLEQNLAKVVEILTLLAASN